MVSRLLHVDYSKSDDESLLCMDSYNFQSPFVNNVHIVPVAVVFAVLVVAYDTSSLLLVSVLLSGDVSKNPGPVQPRPSLCRVMYGNVRGLYGNINDLISASRQFDILLCTETLASQMRHSSEVLVPGFRKPLLVKRDAIPRARGMAVYIRNNFSASHKSCYECGCHEMQVIKVSGKHNNFYLCSIYRNPDLDDSIFDCLLITMAKVQGDDRKAAFVFVGDFNAHHKEWLHSVSATDCHGLRAYDFACESGCEQLIHEATHTSGNCLDLAFTDSPGAIDSRVGSPIGTSDHATVCLTIKTEQAVPELSYSRKIYLKSQADWNGALSDLNNIAWPELYKQAEPVVTLNEELVTIIERRVPSKLIYFRNSDKSWFNADCRRVSLEKQEAYKLWRRNRSQLTWENYTSLRSEAQRVYASAEKEYNDAIKETLRGTSQPHKWWSSLKSALFGVESSIPALLRQDGSVTHCPKEKAVLLADSFDSKQSNEELTFPDSCFPEAKLSSMAFRSREVRNLLLDLGAYGGIDPNGIFPLFFVKTADFMAPKLETMVV